MRRTYAQVHMRACVLVCVWVCIDGGGYPSRLRLGRRDVLWLVAAAQGAGPPLRCRRRPAVVADQCPLEPGLAGLRVGGGARPAPRAAARIAGLARATTPLSTRTAFSVPRLRGFSVPRLRGFSVPRLRGLSVPRLRGLSVPCLRGFSVPRLTRCQTGHDTRAGQPLCSFAVPHPTRRRRPVQTL